MLYKWTAVRAKRRTFKIAVQTCLNLGYFRLFGTGRIPHGGRHSCNGDETMTKKVESDGLSSEGSCGGRPLYSPPDQIERLFRWSWSWRFTVQPVVCIRRGRERESPWCRQCRFDFFTSRTSLVFLFLFVAVCHLYLFSLCVHSVSLTMEFVGYEVGSGEVSWLDATLETPVQLTNVIFFIPLSLGEKWKCVQR